jgi:hypothetical protein
MVVIHSDAVLIPRMESHPSGRKRHLVVDVPLLAYTIGMRYNACRTS